MAFDYFGRMKNGLLILLCFIATHSGFGQKKFTGGFVAGPLTSQMSGDGLGGWDKFGLSFGAFVSAGISEKWAFGTAIQFASKGSRKPADPDNGDNIVLTNQLNYIEVPLYFTYRITDAIHLNAGPYAALLIQQKIKSNESGTLDMNPTFNPFDIGGLIGAEIALGDKINGEIRFTNSLIPARNATVVVNPTNYYERGNFHSVVQLLFSYKLN